MAGWVSFNAAPTPQLSHFLLVDQSPSICHSTSFPLAGAAFLFFTPALLSHFQVVSRVISFQEVRRLLLGLNCGKALELISLPESVKVISSEHDFDLQKINSVKDEQEHATYIDYILLVATAVDKLKMGTELPRDNVYSIAEGQCTFITERHCAFYNHGIVSFYNRGTLFSYNRGTVFPDSR
ncbi:hypothetical protein Ddye_013952 [Dipteronia dyeriana]|uniref:Uncharacterized protein n=1 Tax=Dipteronia dyeriana TaxID=168575 RepID=A0AAD9X7F8_9ROSI|nr:hypothetical protein Ddye_013952 [Dipteronia dyeriana]